MMMPVPKLRPFTLAGLCVHLGIGRSTWRGYRARPAFSPVIEWVESTVWVNQFEGAAADLLNANIIARDLGLADKTDNKTEHGISDEMRAIIKATGREVF